MLIIDPRERYSAEQVLDHQWFKMDFTKSRNMSILKEVNLDFKERKSLKGEGRLSIS